MALYKVNFLVKEWATAYVEASSEEEARQKYNDWDLISDPDKLGEFEDEILSISVVSTEDGELN